MRTPPAAPRTSSGQSIVELAVAMPLLMLLMLGTIDVARVFLDYIEMRNAVVEGATYGTRHPFDTAGIADAVAGHGIPDDVAVSSERSAACDQPLGDGHVTVRATKSFTPVFFATLSQIAPSMDWSFGVAAASKMRCLT